MTIFLMKLWDRFAYYITAGAIVAGVFLYTFLKGRAAGQAALKRQLEKADQASLKRTKKIKAKMEKASEADIDRRLDKYYRD